MRQLHLSDINNLKIAYKSASYIRDVTVIVIL